jgi:hypothetical protein
VTERSPPTRPAIELIDGLDFYIDYQDVDVEGRQIENREYNLIGSPHMEVNAELTKDRRQLMVTVSRPHFFASEQNFLSAEERGTSGRFNPRTIAIKQALERMPEEITYVFNLPFIATDFSIHRVIVSENGEEYFCIKAYRIMQEKRGAKVMKLSNSSA